MQKDSIIILAWPQTRAKAIGRWYDKLTGRLGFIKDGYYNAGHAACVLVDHSSSELHYFDFGRYHMPLKYGRVRNKETDPGLALTAGVHLSSSNKLLNINDILLELSNKEVCHGEGPLYASVLENVNVKAAYNFALGIQNKDAVKYGPYVIRGTNCSRFITSTIKASKPTYKVKFRLSGSILLTPLTKANVFACNTVYYRVENNQLSKHYLTYSEQLKNFMFPYYIMHKNNKGMHYSDMNTDKTGLELLKLENF